MAVSKNTPLPRSWLADSDWTDLLADFMIGDEFQRLMKFVDSERSEGVVFPAPGNVFNAFRYCSFARTRVVILGQDPYHGDNQADGLAFSVSHGEKLPPSLRNIFSELRDDLGIDNGCHGDLTSWAEQGVLLLNTVLTVRRGAAHSHRKRGWETFTDQVIAVLGKRPRPLVFLLWGKVAASKAGFIADQHTAIESAHPSPLSAYLGFFGSKPFSKTNDALVRAGDLPIDWQL